MRSLVLIAVFAGAFSFKLFAQDLGISFSYFLPRNGLFSTPISPFSLRGVGVDFHKNIALESGFSLYRIAGLNIIDIPFKSKEALTGANFTIFIPLELLFKATYRQFRFTVKGGGFFFYGFDQRLNYGNMDKAIRAYKGWGVANSSFSFTNHPGVGYHFGVAVLYSIKRHIGISLECNYLVGQSNFPLRGSYWGGPLNAVSRTMEAHFKEAKIDFTGLEFLIGFFFSSK